MRTIRFLSTSLLLASAGFVVACTPTTAPNVQSGAQASSAAAAPAVERVVLTPELALAKRQEFLDAAIVMNPDSQFVSIEKELNSELSIQYQAPASTTSHFENTSYGISFDVPFNPKWLNDKYSLPPVYEELSGDFYTFAFGPLRYNAEGNSLYRSTTVWVTAPRAASAAVAQYEASDTLAPGSKVEQKTINDIVVVESADQSSETPLVHFLEVVGPHYNYVFGSTDLGIEGLERIVESMKLAP